MWGSFRDYCDVSSISTPKEYDREILHVWCISVQGIQIDLDKKTAGWWFNHSCSLLTSNVFFKMSKGKSSNTDFFVIFFWDLVLSLVKLLLLVISHPPVVEANANVVEVILENITVLLLEQTINYICIWICSDRCPTNCPRFLVSCLPLHLPYLHQILQRPPVLHQLLPLQVMFKLVPTWRRKILDVIKLIPYLCICYACIRFHQIPPASHQPAPLQLRWLQAQGLLRLCRKGLSKNRSRQLYLLCALYLSLWSHCLTSYKCNWISLGVFSPKIQLGMYYASYTYVSAD